jgi:hypothetical protein
VSTLAQKATRQETKKPQDFRLETFDFWSEPDRTFFEPILTKLKGF